MKIIIVHLSDIHMGEDQGSNFILSRTDQLAAAVASTAPDPAACFLIVSGDIAFSGKAVQYSNAGFFIHDLKDRLLKRLGLADIPFLACPGNHDCDFTLQSTLRDIILNDTSRRELDDSVIEACAEVTFPFLHFHRQRRPLSCAKIRVKQGNPFQDPCSEWTHRPLQSPQHRPILYHQRTPRFPPVPNSAAT